MNIMPLMTDAIMADCGYMPNAVFGAYMKMLIAWWRAEAKPMSAARLRMIAGCSEEEFAVIAEHLTETPEGFVQKKLVETFARQTDRSEKAKGSASHRWRKCDDNANASRSHNERIESAPEAQSERNANHEPLTKGSIAEEAILPAPVARKTHADEIREILGSVLRPEIADAVIDHRRKLRKPLSRKAAELLAGKFARCRDGPEVAAETMIARGWQGFEPEWMERNGEGSFEADTQRSIARAVLAARDLG